MKFVFISVVQIIKFELLLHIKEWNTSESWEKESFDAIIKIIPPKCFGLCINYQSLMKDVLQITICFDDIEHAEEDEFNDALYGGCKALFDKYHFSLFFNNDILMVEVKM